MSTHNFLAQIHKILPVSFYRRELQIPFSPKEGWIDGGLCPFHSDKHSGSFRIHTSTGAFKCFSCGAKGGDVIAFVQAKYQLTFKESLLKIAKEWGLK